jgi:hypothetical protein
VIPKHAPRKTPQPTYITLTWRGAKHRNASASHNESPLRPAAGAPSSQTDRLLRPRLRSRCMQKSRGGSGQASQAVATRTRAGHEPLFPYASSAGAWQTCLKTHHRPARESPTTIDVGATCSAKEKNAPHRLAPPTSAPTVTLRATAPPPSPPSAPPHRPAQSCGRRARAWISTLGGRGALHPSTAPMPRPPGLAALALAIGPPSMLPLGWSMPPTARRMFARFGPGRTQPPQHSEAPPRLAPPTSAPAPPDPSPP